MQNTWDFRLSHLGGALFYYHIQTLDFKWKFDAQKLCQVLRSDARVSSWKAIRKLRWLASSVPVYERNKERIDRTVMFDLNYHHLKLLHPNGHLHCSRRGRGKPSKANGKRKRFFNLITETNLAEKLPKLCPSDNRSGEKGDRSRRGWAGPIIEGLCTISLAQRFAAWFGLVDTN